MGKAYSISRAERPVAKTLGSVPRGVCSMEGYSVDRDLPVWTPYSAHLPAILFKESVRVRTKVIWSVRFMFKKQKLQM